MEGNDESAMKIGIDINRDGKPDFVAMFEGKKGTIIACIICFVAGWASCLGYTTLM